METLLICDCAVPKRQFTACIVYGATVELSMPLRIHVPFPSGASVNSCAAAGFASLVCILYNGLQVTIVNAETERHLLDINHSFYDRFARPFADSRSTGQASLRRVLSAIADGAAVLDVGCGDGRAKRS